MAIWWRLDAVVKSASLRGPSLIEQEDRNTPRSGCTEEKTNSMHQASSHSAKREPVVAHKPEIVGSAGARGSRVQKTSLRLAPRAREQEFRGPAAHALTRPGIYQPLSQSQCARSVARSRLALPGKALPNPSLKPSPNSKTPGPRCSACHHLQRGPGVLLSLPAYVER